MNKKIKFLLAMLVALIGIFAVFAMTATAEEKTITISYINSQHTTDTGLDTTAYQDGKQTVTAGEKFTLPTTSSNSFTGQEGYVLVWFTANGRTYMGGEEVSFTEDTTLFRCVAKECATAAEVKTAMGSDCKAAILTADIDSTDSIGHRYQDQAMLVLNGHTFNITRNNTIMGDQRTGKNIIGKGTVNCYVTDNSYGKYKVFESKSHGWAGDQNRIIIGIDVTLNAPNFKLTDDFDGSYVQGYPWVRIYGKVSVYDLGEVGTANRTPRFEFFEGSELTLGGKYLLKDMKDNLYNVQAFQINISGGKFYLPEDAKSIHYWTNDYKASDPNSSYGANELTSANRDKFNITGGSFNVKLPDGLLKNGYECVYNEETQMYDVAYVACDLEGSNGAHSYKAQEDFLGYTVTCDTLGVHYYRCMCGSAYVDEVAALGHSYTAVTIEKIATAAENGIKRVSCENCDDSYTYEYSFDPGDQTITIVVKTEDSTKEITALVKDLYNYTVSEDLSGFVASLDSVKTFADPDNAETTYTLANIVKLVVPAGFTSIKTGAIKNATALEEIVLLDGANVTFANKSIDNCTALKSIVLGDCTVTFSGNTINGNTADLTIDASKANVTTLTSAFEGKSTLKHFVMGTGKSYDFAASTFKNAGIEEFVVPDYATLKAAYATCFNANSLKYVYIGRGITAIDNIFDQCYYMQTIVLMDVTNITGQYFACLANKGEDVLRIYHHATSLSVGNNFLHQSHGVILYTNATGWTGSMSSCSAITKTVGGVEVSYPSYTIVKGIPHQYIEGGIDATCTAMGSTGYTTDCPCGVVEDATYTTYKGVNAGTAVNGTTVIEGSITVGTTTPALGHEFYENDAEKQIIVSTTPATCIKDATITYKCARCDETKTVVQEGTATGHIAEAEWTVTLEPTCAADGFKQKLCTVCSTLAEGEIIPAIGHVASGEWVTTVEATCTVGATRVQYCKNDGCGFVALSETTEPNGHTPSTEWTVTAPATCEKAGEKENRCTVCRAIIEVVEIDALGHEFDIADGATVIAIEYADGFDKAGASTAKCSRCDETSEGEIAPIFTAMGYSVSESLTGLNGGYGINLKALSAYEKINGKLTFGIVIVNAGSFEQGASFLNESFKLNSTKGIQVILNTMEYSSFNCSINGFNATTAETLNLIITSYVVEADGTVSYIQSENDYATSTEIGGVSFDTVTLNLVKSALGLVEAPDAILPSNDEE